MAKKKEKPKKEETFGEVLKKRKPKVVKGGLSDSVTKKGGLMDLSVRKGGLMDSLMKIQGMIKQFNESPAAKSLIAAKKAHEGLLGSIVSFFRMYWLALWYPEKSFSNLHLKA